MGNSCSGAHDAEEVRLDGIASASNRGAKRRSRGSGGVGAATAVTGRTGTASATSSRPSQSRRDQHHPSTRPHHQGRRSATRSATSTAPASATSAVVPTRRKRDPRAPLNPFSDAPLAGSVDVLHGGPHHAVAATPVLPFVSPSNTDGPGPVSRVEHSDDADDDAPFEALPVAAVATFPAAAAATADEERVSPAIPANSCNRGGDERRLALLCSDDAVTLSAVPDLNAELGCAEPSLVSYAASRQPSHYHPKLQQHRHRGSSVHDGSGGVRASSASRAGSGLSLSRGQHQHLLRPLSTPSSSSGQRRGTSSGRSFMTASSYFGRCGGGGSSDASVITTTTTATTPASIQMTSVATSPR